MKANLLIFMAVVPLLGAEAPKSDAVKEELKKFEGTWKLEAANFDGEERKAEDIKNAGLVVVGDTFTMKIGNETHKGKFTIDPSKKPKTIDAEFTEGSLKDTKVVGIYVIEGDTRKSCFAASQTDRPKDFCAGKGKYLWTWKREKP
jgi:uncharacterized protein (TIGR03067 family)